MTRATKAELVERIADLKRERDELRENTNHLLEKVTDAAAQIERLERVAAHDPEARAIAACVKALDEFRKPGSASSDTYGFTPALYDTQRDLGDPVMRRVLRYLADRYGVVWFDPPEVDVAEPLYDPRTGDRIR